MKTIKAEFTKQSSKTVPIKTMKLKLYLAGPMRGIPLYNFPAFFAAAKELRSKGHEVWSPAENDVEVDGFDPVANPDAERKQQWTLSHYMERDLPVICRVDAIAVLPGWEASEGARLEVMVARQLGKQVLNASTLEIVEASTERTVVDKITGGMKGQKLERFDLIPTEPLEELARVYGKGAEKYADDNWRKGYSWRLTFGALMRHAWKFWRGESRDAETGCHHLACAAWHCFTLMWFEKHRASLDDRADKPDNRQ
jgi:hypothetical protein